MHLRSCGPWRAFAAGILCLAGLVVSVHAEAATWQDVRSSVAIRGLATDGHVYVAAATNGIWASTDLKTWQRAGLPAAAGETYVDVIWAGAQFIAVGSGVITSPDGGTWTVRSNPSAANLLNSVVFAGGIYIAVGTDGTRVLRSADGHSWSTVSTHLSLPANWFLSLTGIGSNGSGFVALGSLTQVLSGVTTFEGDELLTSPDGLTWASQVLPISGHDYFDTNLTSDVAYGAGTFVAGGDGGVYTSPDATTWSEDFIPNSSENPFWFFTRVNYLNGQFVASGLDVASSQSAAVFTSSDGVTWSAKNLESRGASVLSTSAVTYGNGQYVAGGYVGVYTSPDASTWSKVFTGPLTNLSYCILNGMGKFVIPGSHGALMSSDGTTWPDTLASIGLRVSASGQGCGAFGAGVFVALDSFGSDIQFSPNGSTWSPVSLPGIGGLYTGVVWTGTQFIAVGVDSSGACVVISSTDGKIWANKGSINTAGATVSLFNATNQSGDLVYVNGTLVAWGKLNGAPFTAASSDGTTWTVSSSGLPSTVTLDSVAYGANHYVALGNNTTGGTEVFTSTDAIHWTPVAGVAANTDTNWQTLIWGNNEFMAGGRDMRTGHALYMTSADGSTWTLGSTSDATTIAGIVWDGTQYIAAADEDILQLKPQSTGGSGGGSGNGGGSSGGGGGGAFGLGLIIVLTGFAASRRRNAK